MHVYKSEIRKSMLIGAHSETWINSWIVERWQKDNFSSKCLQDVFFFPKLSVVNHLSIYTSEKLGVTRSMFIDAHLVIYVINHTG